MPSGGPAERDDSVLFRIVLLVGFSTLFLTASFMGVLAFMSDTPVDVSARLPWYLVVGGAAFVGAIILLEDAGSEGYTIIVTSVVISTLLFVLTLLGVEGVLFTLRRPELVINSKLILYLLSGAMVGVGLAYWGFKHWREFTGNPNQGQL